MAIPEVTNNIITPLAKPVRRPPREIATLIPFARNDRIGIGVAGSVSNAASPNAPICHCEERQRRRNHWPASITLPHIPLNRYRHLPSPPSRGARGVLANFHSPNLSLEEAPAEIPPPPLSKGDFTALFQGSAATTSNIARPELFRSCSEARPLTIKSFAGRLPRRCAR